MYKLLTEVAEVYVKVCVYVCVCVCVFVSFDALQYQKVTVLLHKDFFTFIFCYHSLSLTRYFAD